MIPSSKLKVHTPSASLTSPPRKAPPNHRGRNGELRKGEPTTPHANPTTTTETTLPSVDLQEPLPSQRRTALVSRRVGRRLERRRAGRTSQLNAICVLTTAKVRERKKGKPEHRKTPLRRQKMSNLPHHLMSPSPQWGEAGHVEGRALGIST